MAELHLWSRMHHPNICQFLGAVTKMTDSVILVANYCEQGSLHDVLCKHFKDQNKIPFLQRMRYAQGIACGMSYLHRHALERFEAAPF